MSVKLHPAAEAEFVDAYRWYEKQMKGLGYGFVAAVDEIILKIEDHPFSFPLAYKTFRKQF